MRAPIFTIARHLASRPGLGFKPDIEATAKAVYRDFDELALAAPAQLGGNVLASLGEYLPPHMFQGAANSCVAHAIVGAEYTTLRAKYGLQDPALSSRRWVYLWARLDDDGSDADNGSRPASALQSMANRGVPTEEVFPYSVPSINSRPKPSVRIDARQRKGARRSYQIRDRGDALIKAMTAALRANQAIAISFPWHENLLSSFNAFNHWDKHGKTVGYHMVLGFELLRKDGEYWIGIQNSHGRRYGLDGKFWLSEEYIRNATSALIIDPVEPAQ